jgi:hypothetical protein
MTALKRALPAVAAVLALAGCGGGASAKSFESVEDLAAALGCEDAQVEEEPQMMTDSGFGCEVDGRQVSVYWFADDEQVQSWEDTGQMFTGAMDTGWLRLMGDRWTVTPDDGSRTALEGVQNLIGGDIEE